MKINKNKYKIYRHIENNQKSFRMTQKIYGFFGFCFLIFIFIMSTAHTYQYMNRKMLPLLLLSLQTIKGHFYFENKEKEDLYHHANLVHEHEQVRRLREHQEFMRKTPSNEIRAKLHFRGHKCIGCPDNSEEYMNNHLKDLKDNKLHELKKTKIIHNYYELMNSIEDKENNSSEQYNNFKNFNKQYIDDNNINENNMFKDFDEYLYKIFSFSIDNNIEHVILEFSPNVVNLNNNLLLDYIENNYIKLNMYNMNFLNNLNFVNHNILKYHICENYIGMEYIPIDSSHCIYANIFVFENGILKSIIRK